MDIELLQTFLEVKNTRHFGRAAEQLYITQAAVSARIKQLEDYFRVQLFIRSRNNIQLTAAGERLVEHAENILIAWTQARRDVAKRADNRQQLSIGATSSLWQFVFEPRLSAILKDFPDLELRMEACPIRELTSRVNERTLDIALQYDPAISPELTARPVGRLKLLLASSLPQPTLKRALGDGYVYVDWGPAFAVFHERRLGSTPTSNVHTNTAGIATAIITSRAGSAFLPEQLIDDQAPTGLQLVPNAPTFYRDIFVVYRSTSAHLALIERLADHLAANCLH